MAAMPASASQLIFVPGRLLVTGGLERPRLMVVPLGVRLPAGTLRLAASPAGSTAHPRPSLLPSSALPCVSNASARRGLLRASALGCCSPHVPAPEPGFLAPNKQASRRPNTVACFGVHDEATGDEADFSLSVHDSPDAGTENNRVSKGAGSEKANTKDPGADSAKAKLNGPNEDGTDSDAGKENGVVYNDDGTDSDSGKENGVVSKDDGTDSDAGKENGVVSKEDGNDADAGKENGVVYNDDGTDSDSGKVNGVVSKEDGTDADAGKENGVVYNHDGTGADSGKENGVVSKEDGTGADSGKDNGRVSNQDGTGADSGKENGVVSKDGTDADARKENGVVYNHDGTDADAGKENGVVYNHDGTDADAGKENGVVSKEDGTGADSGKENGVVSKEDGTGADSGKENGRVSKDDGTGADSGKENGRVSKDDGGAGSQGVFKWKFSPEKWGELQAILDDGTGNGNDKVPMDEGPDADDDDTDDGTLQGRRIDPGMIVAELDLFALGYDPMENVYHVSTISYRVQVRAELRNAMRSCSFLLQRAMSRRPPLAERAKELVMIGKSFRVVSKEVEKGFVQSVSVLTAIEGLKALRIVFLGPYIGFLKPLPSREFPFKPPPGTGKKLYFNMLLDYYHTVYDCVSTEILGLFVMDGKDDNFQGFD